MTTILSRVAYILLSTLCGLWSGFLFKYVFTMPNEVAAGVCLFGSGFLFIGCMWFFTRMII